MTARKGKDSRGVFLSLPKAVVARLDQVAEQRYMTRSGVLVQIILQWFESPELLPKTIDAGRPRKRKRVSNGNDYP